MTLEIFLAVIGILLLLCVFANRISSQFGIPSLLIFLAVGMMAGSDGAGIEFYSAQISNYIGSVALAFILFAGGLETQWKSVRPIVFRGVILSTLGVFLTAFFLFFFACYLLRLDFTTALLLSVIVSSTDAPAVFNILRSSNLYLNDDKLKSVLEFESGSNDPMAVILSLSAITMLTTHQLSIETSLKIFILQMGVGFFAGLVFAQLALAVLKKYSFVYQGLYPVFGVSVVCLTFSLTQLSGGNGYLALYICGMVLGNSSYPYRNPFIQFQDALAWVLQIAMFLTLGLLVNPSELAEVFWVSLGASVCLMFFARPLAVFLCLIKSGYSRSEKLFISWAGLKGAVPIILATYPLIAEIPNARYLFNLIFFLVIISVLFQGRTLAPFARFLKLSHEEPSAEELHATGKAPGLPTGENPAEENEEDTPLSVLVHAVQRTVMGWIDDLCYNLPADQASWLKRRLIHLRRSLLMRLTRVRAFCQGRRIMPEEKPVPEEHVPENNTSEITGEQDPS